MSIPVGITEHAMFNTPCEALLSSHLFSDGDDKFL